MSGRPTVTSQYLRATAEHYLIDDVFVWGLLRAAANTIDELEAVTAVRRVEIQPTDRLLLTMPGELSQATATVLGDIVSDWSGLPRVRCLVLAEGAQVAAVATEHQEDEG